MATKGLPMKLNAVIVANTFLAKSRSYFCCSNVFVWFRSCLRVNCRMYFIVLPPHVSVSELTVEGKMNSRPALFFIIDRANEREAHANIY